MNERQKFDLYAFCCSCFFVGLVVFTVATCVVAIAKIILR